LQFTIIETVASGLVVPRFIIVAPIMTMGMPSFLVAPAVPSTNQSKPLKRAMKLATRVQKNQKIPFAARNSNHWSGKK
jgi:hypothetical protein